MSDFKWNAGNGGLFVNRKEKDSQPDYRGELNWNGTVLEISGWKKEGKNGTWLSLSAREKGSFQQKEKPSRNDRADTAPGFDDQIPF